MVTCGDISNTFLQSAGIHCFTISWDRGCSYSFVQKDRTWTCLTAFWMIHTWWMLFQHCCIGLHSHQKHFSIAARLKRIFLSSTAQAVSELAHRRIKDTEGGQEWTCHTVSQTFLHKESAMELICLDLREVISCLTYISENNLQTLLEQLPHKKNLADTFNRKFLKQEIREIHVRPTLGIILPNMISSNLPPKKGNLDPFSL